MEFIDFDLHDSVVEGIEAMGFKEATPIQEQAIPAILSGRDLIASAQTGTGKTAAFTLPIIDEIGATKDDGKVKALIICPTRELAVQISQHIEGMSYFTSVSSIAVYGGGDGASFAREKKAMTQGVDIIVGTPGRIIAHLTMGNVDLSELMFFVLDEADRMLDMGFLDDIMKIESHCKKVRQNLLFSATMPPKIRTLAKKILTDPNEISIAISKPAERIKQMAFVVYEDQKLELLKYIFGKRVYKSVIIFCSSKIMTKQLAQSLKAANLKADAIHSDLEQSKREEVLMDFKSGKLAILVATDIIARGIDIDEIEMVVNYDVPRDGESYVHRIGRTARAAASGKAYTFVSESERKYFYEIEELLEMEVPKANVPGFLGRTPRYDREQLGSRKPRGNKRNFKQGKGRPNKGPHKPQR